MNTLVNFTKWTLAGIFMFMLFSCAESRHVTTRQSMGKINFNRIAVLPYRVVQPDAGDTIAHCPLSGDPFMAGRVEAQGAETLTELLREKLSGRPLFYPAPPAVVENVWKDVLACQKPVIEPTHMSKLGKELGADGLLLGFVYAFRERVGTVYSVETPALVSFDLYLVESASGRVVWKASYTRSQQSLTENILDIGEYVHGGMRWLTARELADLGLTGMLRRFPVM
jgi:hypothetical protein